MGLGILAIVRQQSPFRVGIFSPVHRLGRFEFLVLFFLEAKENTHVIVIVTMRLMPRLLFPLPGRSWLLWFTKFYS
jgi:hypothetical protein